MIIDIVTIFPNFFNEFLETSIIKKAIENDHVVINVHDLRDYSDNKHKQIDDTPYGGGVGMLMTFPPFYEIINKLKTNDTKVILLSPQGKVFNQGKAFDLSKENHLIRSEEHTSELQSRGHLVCRLLLEKKN